MQRRRFIGAGGSLLGASLGGCISIEDPTGDEGGDGGGNDNGDDSSQSSDGLLPDPTAVDLRYPEPQAVSTDDSRLGNGRYEFSVTVENTGMAGDIRLTLVLREDQNESIWSMQADEAGSYDRFFASGERRSESFSASVGNHEAYGFRLVPADAEVDVRNDGGDGDVNVRILQSGGVGDGTVIEEKTVAMDGETTRTVAISIDPSFVLETEVEGIQLDAEASAEGTSQ